MRTGTRGPSPVITGTGSGVIVSPDADDERVLPWATFTSPEVGRVGLTEAEAARRHPGRRAGVGIAARALGAHLAVCLGA